MKKNSSVLLLLLSLQTAWAMDGDDLMDSVSQNNGSSENYEGDGYDMVEGQEFDESTTTQPPDPQLKGYSGGFIDAGPHNDPDFSGDGVQTGVSDISALGVSAHTNAVDDVENATQGLDFMKLGGDRSDSSNTQATTAQKIKDRDKALNDRLDLLQDSLKEALKNDNQEQVDAITKEVEREKEEYNSIDQTVSANLLRTGRDWNLSLSRYGRGRNRETKTADRLVSLTQAKTKLDSLESSIDEFNKNNSTNDDNYAKQETDQVVPDSDSSSLNSENQYSASSRQAREPLGRTIFLKSDSSDDDESSTGNQNSSNFSFDGVDDNSEESDIDREEVGNYDPDEMDRAMEEMSYAYDPEDDEDDDWAGVNIGRRSEERMFGSDNNNEEKLSEKKLDYKAIEKRIWSDDDSDYYGLVDDNGMDDSGDVARFKADLDNSNLSNKEKDELKKQFNDSFPDSVLKDENQDDYNYEEQEKYEEEKQTAYNNLSKRISDGEIRTLKQLKEEPDYKKTGDLNRSDKELSSTQFRLKFELEEKLKEDKLDKRRELNKRSKNWRDPESNDYNQEYTDLYDSDDLNQDAIDTANLSPDQKEHLTNEREQRDEEEAEDERRIRESQKRTEAIRKERERQQEERANTEVSSPNRRKRTFFGF